MSIFTDEQKRVINANDPTLSVVKPGIGLADVLEAHDAKFVSGTVTVLDTATTATATVGAAFNGKPVLVTFGEAPTAATIVSAAVAAGTLTVTIDQDNTADLDVHYFIDGR